MARKRKQAIGKQRQVCNPKVSPPTSLREALQWFVKDTGFADLKVHGNVGWTGSQLVVLAVLWVWSDCDTLTGAFSYARNVAETTFGSVAVTTFQGLTGALRSYGSQLLSLLWVHLHKLMERSAGRHWRIGKWLPLAVDGSRVTTPRTASNEQAFSAKNYGQGGRGRNRSKWKNKKRRSKKLSEPVKPQIWLTLLWHMGLKMPWCWKTGPSTACERQHLLEMLDALVFPAFTLFCGDAGFVGYEFWSTIVDRKHSFLIRVGANVRLLRNLGTARQKNGLVNLWPNEAARKKQPPLVLRLIELKGPRGNVYLVTNVLSERELSLKQARELYRARWGIELQFRALKQTFGRTKLRSRTAENALVELDWSLVGLWLIQLFAVKEQIKIDSPPAQSSVALALAVIQEAMQNWSRAIRRPKEFARRLGQATKDTYTRTRPKRSRYRPAYKDKPTVSKPIVKNATRAQRKAYKQFETAM
jgi:hypothetical protein